MFMLFILFFLWIILNGRITPEICLIGVMVCGGVYAFCMLALGYRPRQEKQLWKRMGGYCFYVAVLLLEILKANLAVMRLILTPKAAYHPAILRLQVPLQEKNHRVLLSNSITLTPGTVTVEEKNGTFLVLCLDKAMGDDIPQWSLVRILKKLEEKAWN